MNKKIVFWVPGGMPLMLHVEGAIAKALINRGHDVQMIICDGTYKACIRREIKDEIPVERWKDLCKNCVKSTSAELEKFELPYKFIGDFVKEPKKEELRKIAEQNKNKDYSDLEYNGIPIGKNIKSGIIRYLQGAKVELSDDVIEEYLYSGLICTEAAINAFNFYENKDLFLSHGIYVDWGPALQVAYQKKLNIFAWMASYLHGHFYFRNIKDNVRIDFHNIDNESWSMIKSSPFSKVKNDRLEMFLHNRYFKNNCYDMKTMPEMLENYNLIKSKYFPGSKKQIWGIFTHINWDAVSDYSPMVYSTFDEWILETVKTIINITEVNWLIRIHPAEKWEVPFMGVEELIKRNFVSLPDHIKIIPAESEINTKDFISIIDGGITVYGTAGIEVALSGKPVILAGDAHYGNKGFTIDSSNIDEYTQNLLNVTKLTSLDENQISLAKKYAYNYFIERQIPLPVVMDYDVNYWTYQQHKTDMLWKGNDVFIEFICGQIANAGNFIMDEKLVKEDEKLIRNRYEIKDITKTAVSKYLEGDYREALKLLQNANQLNDQISEVYYLISLTLFAINENETAFKTLLKAIEKEPYNTNYINLFINNINKKDNYSVLEIVLKKYLSIGGKNMEIKKIYDQLTGKENKDSKKLLSGYDSNGIVYIKDNNVFREINKEYWNEVVEIYNTYKNYKLYNLGIIETEIAGENLLKHKKLQINYPYEWSITMFREAFLFHLNLFIELDKYGIVLKDAVPNNIIYENTRPVFVDFLSLIKNDKLHKETWLVEQHYKDQRFAIIDKMLVPFFFLPFLALVIKKYGLFRNLLKEKFCNSPKGVPVWEDLLHHGDQNDQIILKSKEFLEKTIQENDFITCIKKIKLFIEEFNTDHPGSGYETYYEDKRENYSYEKMDDWQNKQKSVYKLLKRVKPKTVLDLGANTGWFSMLATRMGAQVVATEIDEASLDRLYKISKNGNEPILSSYLSFQDFDQSYFGNSYPEDPVLRDRKYSEIPLYVSPLDRLNSEVTVCLGLLHHLTLGLGVSFEEFFDIITRVTSKSLIVEFVQLNDRMILENDDFFPLRDRNTVNTYSIELFLETAKNFFKYSEIYDSQPETRKILFLTNDAKYSSDNQDFPENESELNLKAESIITVPSQFAIGITNICNLRCPLCVTGLRQQKKELKFIDFDLFTDVIEKIKNHATIVQLYKWGESFLHKDIVKILEYCTRYDLNTEISSNLNFTDDEKLEATVKYRLKKLIVSFDGVNQVDYERYRVGGNFELVLGNIEKINKYKNKYKSEFPTITLQYLKNKFTTTQIETIKNNYKNWGADEYIVYDMTTVFKDNSHETARKWFTDEEITRRRFLDVDVCFQGKHCLFLNEFMVIEQDGSIASCCYSTNPDEDFGRWDKNKSLVENYNSPRRQSARKMFNEKKGIPGFVCSDCTIFKTYCDPELKGKPEGEPVAEKNNIEISIIIPSYNRANMIGITLESFIRQNFDSNKYEIIVADNNSTDNTAEVIKTISENSRVNINYLFEQRQGVHFARNSAAKIARGKILYFTDDDMIADSNLLTEIIKPFEDDKKVGTATGRVLPKWETTPPDWVKKLCYNGLLSLNDHGEHYFIDENDFGVWSCHQAILREVFFKSEGFNPENTSGFWVGDGETGLNIKVKQLGYKFAYNGKSVIYHMIPKARMTQDYLNKRMANQGNCDTYTDFRKNSYDNNDLHNQIDQFAVKLNEFLLKYINKRNNRNIEWRLDLSRVHYYLSRMEYNYNLINSAKWCELVRKNDWLSNDSFEFNDVLNDTELTVPLQSEYEKKKDIQMILKQFEDEKIPIQKEEIDIEDFLKWMKLNPEILEFYKNSNDVIIEKCLEHYLAFKLLELNAGDYYIDIACNKSVFAEVLRRKAINAYKLDTIYPSGINGLTIGASCTQIPFENESINGLSLQCAFECFEGVDDVDFIKEAKRILTKNGRLVIVPLYLNTVHINIICEQPDNRVIPIDEGAIKVYRDDIYTSPFDREYSVGALNKRILSKLESGYEIKIINFTNLKVIESLFENQRIYCNFLLYIKKV